MISLWETLPGVISRRVVGYLPIADTIQLSHTSRMLYAQVSVGKTKPVTLFDYHFGELNGNTPKRHGFEIPVTQLTEVLSVIIEADWDDTARTGWKGKLFVVENSETETGQEPYFDLKSCLAQCETRKTNFKYQTLRLSFTPKPGHTYGLWYQVCGGGPDYNGSDTVGLSRIKMELLFSNGVPSRGAFKRAHNFLVLTKSFRIWERMAPRHITLCSDGYDMKKLEEVHGDIVEAFLDSTRQMLEEGKKLPSPTIAFFENFHVKKKYLTLSMLELIKKIRGEWEAKGTQYICWVETESEDESEGSDEEESEESDEGE